MSNPHYRLMHPVTITISPPSHWDGERLRTFRRRYGWSQKALADILGKSAHVTISQWENEVHKIPTYICRTLDLIEEQINNEEIPSFMEITETPVE